MGGEVVEFPIGSFVLVEHSQSNLRRGPKSKLLPFLKGPMKVMAINGDKYLLRNLITRRDKEYHIQRLFEYRYDPSTLSPLKVACKDRIPSGIHREGQRIRQGQDQNGILSPLDWL